MTDPIRFSTKLEDLHMHTTGVIRIASCINGLDDQQNVILRHELICMSVTRTYNMMIDMCPSTSITRSHV